MRKSNPPISVFEHESIRFDAGDKRIPEDVYKALQKHYKSGMPYYSLQYNGVKFNEYVGVIQVGNTLIEVLPKADKFDTDSDKWRKILIGMLKAVGAFDIESTSTSNLKLKTNTILDLYFEMFIKEVEFLLHNGLIKKYRKHQGNLTALKGSLHFGKHTQQNVTHQERFYVNYTTYDTEHLLHVILYKAINLLRHINTNAALQSRIEGLILNFPEMPDCKVTEATFAKISFNRKNQSYQKAIEIARLLLLQYHPDLSKGRNSVLALMFDMNELWEQFIYVSIRKFKGSDTTAVPQSTIPFWQPQDGCKSTIKPDIVLNKGEDNCVVLDTKWKNLYDSNPSPEDLRQMYAYHKYYVAKKVALVYPGVKTEITKGNYLPLYNGLNEELECSVISFCVEPEVRVWQENIYKYLNAYLIGIPS